MTSNSRTIAWQDRLPHDKPVAIHSGIERPWDGSVPDLLEHATAVSLKTRDGAEVQVGNLHLIGADWWEGDVLRAAAGAVAPGRRVAFGCLHVLAATI
jgi:hypothetical protein